MLGFFPLRRRLRWRRRPEGSFNGGDAVFNQTLRIFAPEMWALAEHLMCRQTKRPLHDALHTAVALPLAIPMVRGLRIGRWCFWATPSARRRDISRLPSSVARQFAASKSRVFVLGLGLRLCLEHSIRRGTPKGVLLPAGERCRRVVDQCSAVSNEGVVAALTARKNEAWPLTAA
jgi:hypothetical protein